MGGVAACADGDPGGGAGGEDEGGEPVKGEELGLALRQRGLDPVWKDWDRALTS